jgi:hypothetical protein
MTRERIEDMREVVLPFVTKRLMETNYENLGESDAKEFAKDFNEILALAIKGLEQESTTKNDLEVASELEKNSKKLEKDFGELDCISRVESVRIASGYCHPSNIAKELAKLPSVTPQEPKEITWEDVKEYCEKRCLTIVTNQLFHELTHHQEPILDKIRAEIEKEADTSNRLQGISEIGLRKALKIIDKYKADRSVEDGNEM